MARRQPGGFPPEVADERLRDGELDLAAAMRAAAQPSNLLDGLGTHCLERREPMSPMAHTGDVIEDHRIPPPAHFLQTGDHEVSICPVQHP